MRAGFALIALALASALTAQVTFDDIRHSPGANWLTYAGDYQGRRHSPLTQIDRENVGSLVPKWVYRVEGATHLESSPLVYDGVMYVTNSNEVHALDARTGRRIWIYRDDRAASQRVNRGAALLGDRVFFITSDCFLVALDRRTGAVLWSKQYADPKKGYYASLAPLAVKDRIVVGVSGGDSGMRGFLASYSPSTGEELWRFYTIPAKGEAGSETWGDFAVEWGGGATWLSGTYDPDLNLLYWPTGNPWPDFYGGGRRGDDLYSCSVVALDLDTGKLKWHFQFTPHDTHDWDAESWPVLVDLPFNGRMRKLLLHPNRNGFFYVLDRASGEFLRATKYLNELTWASGVDSKGRPVEVPGQEPSPGGTRTCPGTRGGSNWMSPSFDPATGLFYVPTVERCDKYYSSAKEPVPMRGFAGGGGERIPDEGGKIFLRALDPKTGERRWDYPMTGRGLSWAGTVSTAGGVVFFGDDDGQLVAVDAQTGRHLWNFNMGQLLTASPVTYSVDGKQYVSIAAATSVFTFGLFEPVKPMPLLNEQTEEHNVLTPAEKAAGWVLLFDGKTMDHWQDPRKLDPPGDAWMIEDGCLKPVSHARIGEDLVSSKTYRDFELQWDWRISPGGNTGVKYRIQEFPILLTNAGKFETNVELALSHRLFDRHLIPAGAKAAIYPLGFEYQMIDNTRHPDAKRGPLYQTGALYSILPPAMDATLPVGEFNHSKLVVRGDHFEHWLNGKKILDVTVTPELLKHALGKRWGEDSLAIQQLSGQPRKDCPITLQNHGDAAWFRAIKIKPLN